MENRTGRLDLLVLGIAEQFFSCAPEGKALFRLLEPQLRLLLRPLDCPSVRETIREAARQQKQEEFRAPAAAVKSPKRPSRKPGKISAAAKADVVTISQDGKAVPVEAEWIA